MTTLYWIESHWSAALLKSKWIPKTHGVLQFHKQNLKKKRFLSTLGHISKPQKGLSSLIENLDLDCTGGPLHENL
jgi:hypothetical protein